MTGLERLVNSPELAEAIRSFNQVAKEVNALVELAEIRKLTGNLDDRAETMASSFEHSMAEANEAFRSLGAQLADDSELHYQLSRALQELTESARSLRNLADTIERNPETLLKGKR